MHTVEKKKQVYFSKNEEGSSINVLKNMFIIRVHGSVPNSQTSLDARFFVLPCNSCRRLLDH